ncbi:MULTISPECIES: CHAT domain-containing protein [Nostocales]|uniref:CHAT domain-containing protein n=3 Tax=Nostocales TaxID=1161 RepID=A0A0C1QTV6_9CYAN|nr:CHAT domain-containing protein [Tolypothrix bouteillei]KAF3889275.1 CHAT domain-containing protein [Tolypothrix bouteillei VB521301]
MGLHQCLKTSRLLNLFFLCSFTICLCLGQVSLTFRQIQLGGVVIARSLDWKHLMQQGLNFYRTGDFQGAISLWEAALSSNSQQKSEDTVTVLKYLVRAYQQVGRIDRAIATLNQLIAHYQKVGASLQLGRMLAELAQVYSSLGQQRKAIALLCGDSKVDPNCIKETALNIARNHSDTLSEVTALGSLGNAHRLQGDYEQAIKYFEKVLTVVDYNDYKLHVISALTGLGNTYTSLAKRDYRRLQFAKQAADKMAVEKFARNANDWDSKAIAFFEKSIALARRHNEPINELRSLLNLFIPYHRSRTDVSLGSTLQQALNVLKRLPDSRDKAYAAIRLASLYQLLSLPPATSDAVSATRCLSTNVPFETVELLQQAIAIAQRLKDQQSVSFALGRLGHVYECRQNYPLALQLTQQAQLVAGMQESRYLWDWQAGRILQALSRTKEAIAFYKSSVKTLKEIRGDLAIAGRDFQFDFRDTVEPIYRELTELYLEQAQGDRENGKWGDEKNHKSIESALETIDSLRLAELQNYLGDDCSLEAIVKPVTLIDEKTAVISTMILKNRVAVILTLLNQDKSFQSHVYWIPATSQDVITTVNQLRLKLEKRSDLANTYQEKSQQVYDWLIHPFAKYLQQAQIETLVFIQDGILRSIPMAALYDGNQFLVEQYAIASTLSLTLVDPAQLNRKSLQVLGFGLTKPSVVEGPTFFEPLNYVKSEIDSITTILPGSKGLIDDAFTLERLKQELTKNPFPIIHLATHGKFGIDSQDTFLVTGKKYMGDKDALNQNLKLGTYNYNEKLTMNQLYQIIQEVYRDKSLDLLTLTACETAAGSDRDALGIAGISLQAGARSVVASLWQVDDESTAQLITQFYRFLGQGMSRAKALQSAQKIWLQEHRGDRSHPGYWAALILVGSWL